MAGADVIEPLLKELEEATEEQEEALKEEELLKREPVLEKPNNGSKRIRASAAGSSSQPCQLPPPCPAAHIHRLPDDVLEKIFEPLPLKTIANVLSVCHRWRAVIEDRNLIKNLKFQRGTFPAQEALSLVHSAPNLKSLELFRRSDTVDLLYAVSARCTSLLHLSLDFGYTSVSVTEALRSVFQNNPHITHLHLRNVDIFDRLQFFQELGAALPDLRKLKLYIGSLSDVELDALFEGCSRNQMEELKVCFSPWSGKHIARLVQFWGRSLQVLELDASNWTDGEWAQLAGCSELRQLKLEGLSTPGDWLRGLAVLAHLEELVVSHEGQVEQEKWCRFFSQSRSSNGLRKFSFRNLFGVDDSVLASVAAFCPQLEELDVSNTNLTISVVREVLQCCRNLRNLYFKYPSGEMLQIVGELPRLAPQLRRIRIGCDTKDFLDEYTLRCVKAQMPHLRID